MVLIRLGDAITTQEFVKENGGTITLLLKEEERPIVSEFIIIETGTRDIIVAPVDNPEKKLLAMGDDEIIRADIGSSAIILG